MNTLYNIELYSQAEKNRVLDGIRLLIKQTSKEQADLYHAPPDRWRESKIKTKIRHIQYLESLYMRIKLTKGKKPKVAFASSNTRFAQR